MHPEYPHLNIAVTGHVDHGKSTLVGRLLVDTGEVPEHEYENYREEAAERQREHAALAYLSDERLEERSRGMSVVPSYSRLLTDDRLFTLIDCPGHRYYTGNMIRGVSQSDAAILVVSASDGVQELTREHAIITQAMGGDSIVVAVTKMDAVDYDAEVFESVKAEIEELLADVTRERNVQDVIPVSGHEGRNVTPDDEGIAWYDGPSLLEAMHEFEIPPDQTDAPLRIPIDEKHTMSGIGTTVAGTIRTGSARVDDKIVFEPSGTECTIRSMEMHHETVAKAGPGDNVGLNLSGAVTVNVEPGNVGGHPDDPPQVARSITAELYVVNRPPTIKPSIKPVFHAHAVDTPCEVIAVTRQGGESGMDTLSLGDQGTVELRFPEPIVVEPAETTPSLGRFLLRDNNETVAVGKVTSIVDEG